MPSPNWESGWMKKVKYRLGLEISYEKVSRICKSKSENGNNWGWPRNIRTRRQWQQDEKWRVWRMGGCKVQRTWKMGVLSLLVKMKIVRHKWRKGDWVCYTNSWVLKDQVPVGKKCCFPTCNTITKILLEELQYMSRWWQLFYFQSRHLLAWSLYRIKKPYACLFVKGLFIYEVRTSHLNIVTWSGIYYPSEDW